MHPPRSPARSRPRCLAACAGLAGCFLSPLPDAKTPADRARELAPRCQSFSEQAGAGLLSRDPIESVEPAYSYVQSGSNDHEARLRGARIHFRPLPGLTPESLARTLECHEARVTLGEVSPTEDDPYVLPDRWLDIDVDSERDGFVASVRVDAFEDARRILDRAKRYASRP